MQNLGSLGPLDSRALGVHAKAGFSLQGERRFKNPEAMAKVERADPRFVFDWVK